MSPEKCSMYDYLFTAVLFFLMVLGYVITIVIMFSLAGVCGRPRFYVWGNIPTTESGRIHLNSSMAVQLTP